MPHSDGLASAITDKRAEANTGTRWHSLLFRPCLLAFTAVGKGYVCVCLCVKSVWMCIDLHARTCMDARTHARIHIHTHKHTQKRSETTSTSSRKQAIQHKQLWPNAVAQRVKRKPAPRTATAGNGGLLAARRETVSCHFLHFSCTFVFLSAAVAHFLWLPCVMCTVLSCREQDEETSTDFVCG